MQRAQRDPGPDGGKAVMIKDMVQTFRDLAKEQMMEEFPELRMLINQTARMKQEMRQPHM